MGERLHKVLARAGIGSRRTCETYIAAGRVRVDGVVVSELGAKVDIERQTITFDGRLVRPEPLVYYLVNKPKNFLCTNDKEAHCPRVIDLIPQSHERLFTVGRLDKDSTGLIIVTNDGELSNALTHPRYGVTKTYVARVSGYLESEDIERLKRGVYLAEGRTSSARISVIHRNRDFSTVRIEVNEGRNRLIRRMFARLGHKVRELHRAAIGPLTLGNLKIGEWRPLSKKDIERLYALARPENGS